METRFRDYRPWGKYVGGFLNSGPFGVLFIRVPYCVWDLQGDLDLENYPRGESRGRRVASLRESRKSLGLPWHGS